MLHDPSKSHGPSSRLAGIRPLVSWSPVWLSDHLNHRTTCATWCGREKAEEHGYRKTQDPRALRTGFSRARPVLQNATVTSSSCLGQRESQKASRACVPSPNGLLFREDFCGTGQPRIPQLLSPLRVLKVKVLLPTGNYWCVPVYLLLAQNSLIFMRLQWKQTITLTSEFNPSIVLTGSNFIIVADESQKQPTSPPLSGSCMLCNVTLQLLPQSVEYGSYVMLSGRLCASLWPTECSRWEQMSLFRPQGPQGLIRFNPLSWNLSGTMRAAWPGMLEDERLGTEAGVFQLRPLQISQHSANPNWAWPTPAELSQTELNLVSLQEKNTRLLFENIIF